MLLAIPLTVVCFVLVKKLWMQDILQENVGVPGEDDDERGYPES